LFILPIALLLLLILAPLVGAYTPGITQSDPSPADNATNVYVRTTLSVTIEEADGETMNGTILFVATSDTLTISTASNGSQVLTISSDNLPLAGTTTYQWWCNVSNETGVWSNQSYNFTTGTYGRARDNPDLNAAQLLLIGLIIIVIVLGVASYGLDIANSKKLEVDKLIGLVIIVSILVIALGFI